MEYEIVNLELIPKGDDRNYLEKHLEMFIKKMSIIPKKYRKSNSIQLSLSNVVENQLKLNISANLNTGYVYTSQIGDNIKSIVPKIFDLFTKKIAKEIEHIRKQFSLDKKSAFLEATALDKKNLSNLSDEKRVELFKSIIPIFLPALKGYIKRRILSAKRAELKSLSNVDSKDAYSWGNLSGVSSGLWR